MIGVLWYMVAPMARPGARGLGPRLDLKYGNCVAGRAGPGLDILFAGLIIQFAGRAWAQISSPCRALLLNQKVISLKCQHQYLCHFG